MEKESKFKLSHLTLYAKGWYKNSDNVWDDLIEILKLDGYTPFHKGDVYYIVSSRFSEFDCRQSELREVLQGIHPNNCWKSGYYTEGCNWVENSDTLPKYDMPTAFIYYVLSSLRFLDNKNWNVVTPKYKLFPKNPDIKTKRVIEHFNKKA